MFRRYYNDLQDGIQSPSVLAGLLYSSNIIDADVRDIVQLSVNTVRRKNQLLLNAAKRLYTHISKPRGCTHTCSVQIQQLLEVMKFSGNFHLLSVGW